MAYLIDETYFQRELFVPNADDTDRSAYTELQEFIDNKSRLLLKEVLGYTLFKDLDQNITNGILDAGAPQKWLNLVNGVEYVKDGYTYYWEGLLVQEGAFKKSLLANFVFYHWLYYNQSTMSGVGEVVLNAKNATNINSTQRLTSVWNEFVNMYQGKQTKYTYSEYRRNGIKVIDWVGNNTNDYYSSLIMFLSDNEETYAKAPLKMYHTINQFGL
tara:strand:- start:475 stop:1119 length:645 start_codon:yes stop_codon:yes gene_type:complete